MGRKSPIENLTKGKNRNLDGCYNENDKILIIFYQIDGKSGNFQAIRYSNEKKKKGN